MKRLLTLVAIFATLQASAQQVNPVPDYVFRNQMSVGRNAVTDTAAYFSIGPRYGATKGFMPPIVGDTATFSSGKRNGLLIFSVQKNKFLYWDSVRVQWSDMAGSSGSYIVAGDTSAMLTPYLRKADTTSMLTAYLRKGDTASMLSPYYRSAAASAALALKLNISDTSTMLGNYVRHAGYGLTKSGQSFLVDTLNIATRAWRQKGLDSLAALEVSGSGTTNYVPKFTAGSTIGNSQIFDNGTNVGIGTTSPNTKTEIFGGDARVALSAVTTSTFRGYQMATGTTEFASLKAEAALGELRLTSGFAGFGGFTTMYTNGSERLRITSGGHVGIGIQTPANNGTGETGVEIRAPNYPMLTISTPTITQFQGVGLTSGYTGTSSNHPFSILSNGTTRLYIQANGRIGINTTTDAGYLLDVNGTLRTVNGANFATTSGNVGIGNASPSFKLSVNSSDYQIGNLASTYITGGINYNALIVGQIALNQSAQIGYARDTSNAANSFFYVTPYGSAEGGQFRMSAAGNVGIGFTSNPSYKLDVNGTLRSVNGANFATTSGNVGIGTASPTSKLDVVENAVAINQLRVGQDAVHKVMIGAETNFAEIQAIRVGVDFNKPLVLQRQGGNVGVGTSLPTTYAGYTTLAVNNATNGGVIDIMRNNSVVLQIFGDAGASGIGSLANVPFTFKTNSIEQGRINTAGEFLLNSTNSDAGDYKLQVSGNIYNTGSAVLAATSGNVGIGVVPSAWNSSWKAVEIQQSGNAITSAAVNSVGITSNAYLDATNWKYGANGTANFLAVGNTDGSFAFYKAASGTAGNTITFTQAMTLNNASELLVNTTSDAGDYKLQVVGNARIGTGKLDIASNTTFGLGVARSGTSEVAGQIYNSNGILYLGAESSAGGQIFSGSSAYAAVIGSGANYPLQFAVNNTIRGGFNTGGELMINTTNDQGAYVIQANGSIYNTGQVTRGQFTVIGTSAQLFVDSTTNLSTFYGTQFLTGSNNSPFLGGVIEWNTSGNVNAIDIYINNTASGSNSNFMQLGDGTNNFKVTKDASIMTANPTGGTAKKWRLGSAATVSPTSPNRTIQVEVDGVIYYLHAKTTND